MVLPFVGDAEAVGFPTGNIELSFSLSTMAGCSLVGFHKEYGVLALKRIALPGMDVYQGTEARMPRCPTLGRY